MTLRGACFSDAPLSEEVELVRDDGETGASEMCSLGLTLGGTRFT
jgi:hypothetical protein